MKIAIIGYSGAGKSTLAEKLSNYYSIPKLHMDTLQFQPGWQDSDREWMLSEMKNFLTKHEAWVIDGNYSWCYYEERIQEADQIIFLNFSAWNCLLRAFKRYLKYRGKVRESMAKGCPEQFNWELFVGFSGMVEQKMLRIDTNTYTIFTQKRCIFSILKQRLIVFCDL